VFCAQNAAKADTWLIVLGLLFTPCPMFFATVFASYVNGFTASYRQRSLIFMRPKPRFGSGTHSG
jgi:hypothetical protein